MPINPKTLSIIRTYIDEGVPLEDLDMTAAQRERVRVAEKVYERLQADPMLDVMRCLRRTFGRTREQALKDRDVVALFVECMDEPNRKILTYRARKTAERLVRIGEQTGDAKWIDKGLSQLVKLDRLAEEDVPQEDVRNTASLPVVIVGIETVNPDRTSVDDDEFRRLMQKYGGKEDDFGKMLALRVRRLQGEDMNMLAHEELDEDEQPIEPEQRG